MPQRASTDNRGLLRKTDIANVIAAYLATAGPDDTARQAIEYLILALGIAPEYIENLLRTMRAARRY